MTGYWQWLAVLCCLVTAAPGSAEDLAKGKLLVADPHMQSDVFSQSVILLLDYSRDAGAAGLIVNHPSRLQARELLPPAANQGRYRGPVYLGGPVEVYALLALLRTDTPPPSARQVFGHIHMVPPEESLRSGSASDSTHLRFYVGYVGWAPGQLENEIARGDWRIRDATEELVFAKDPAGIWRKLSPERLYKAGIAAASPVNGPAPARRAAAL